MTQHYYEDIATKLAANMSATRPNTAMDVVRVTDLSGTTLAVNFDVRVENEILRVTAISVDGGGSGIDRWTASHLGGAAATTHGKGQEVEVILTAYALSNDIGATDDDSAFVTKATLTTNGDIFARIAGAVDRLAIGTTGQFLKVVSGLPAWVSSVLTTKGDLYTRDSSGDQRLAVGSNGQVLTADSAQATGIKWAAAGGGSSPLTTKGDVYTHDATVDARLAVGSNGQVLTADSAEATGIKWAAASGGGGSSPPTVIQGKTNGTAVSTITMDQAPGSGHSIILFVNGFNTGTSTAVSSTNTTWTKMLAWTGAGGAKYDVWVGVVSGAGGTVITVTHPNSFCTMAAIEITDALTPTLVSSTTTTAAELGQTYRKALTSITAGHLVVIVGGADNTNAGQEAINLHAIQGSVGLETGVTAIVALYAPSSGRVEGVTHFGGTNNTVGLLELT